MPPRDQRPTAVVLKQYRELVYLRQQLAKEGLVAKDAPFSQVLEAVRSAVPPDLVDDDGSAK